MVYAHSVTMGGFASDVSSIHNSLKKVTLTPFGILLLAQHGFFCNASRKYIEDKSKADLLAKSLVCLQVLLVIGQAIERHITQYPTTLLEIHTIVHAVCALVMYSLWFKKPLNIQVPIVIEFGENEDLLAMLVQLTSLEYPGYQFSKVLSWGQKCSECSGSLGFTRNKSPVLENTRYSSRPGFNWPEFGFFKMTPPYQREIAVHESWDKPILGDLPVSNSTPLVTQYSLAVKGADGISSTFALGELISSYVPSSEEPVVCQLYSGQILRSGLARISSMDTLGLLFFLLSSVSFRCF